MIEWKDEYSVSNEAIDNQHKQLFAIAGKAYALLKDNLVTDKYDQIVAILDELKDYTVYHFSFEEEYMKSIGYKKFLSHKTLHDDFIERINNVNLNTIDENQHKYILDTLDFIVNWIGEHILGSDKQYAK
ncbi:MAG: bacteriohemerythrin [Methylocystaceae bacterium]